MHDTCIASFGPSSTRATFVLMPNSYQICNTLNFYFHRLLFSAYRTNKFCDEHLRIDNEPVERLKTSPKMVRIKKKGDPVAEARIQNEQSFTHLKIIKSTDVEELPTDNKSMPPMAAGENPKKQNKSSRIYSQVIVIYSVTII